MNLEIDVTLFDIATGVPCDGDACPIVHAVARTLKVPLERVQVGAVCVYVDGIGDAYLPATAIEFVDRFDRGERVQPIRFPLFFELATGATRAQNH
jgi:hypothetical protein